MSDGKDLNERGQAHSTLVSAGIPPSIVKHWFVRVCRISLQAWGRFVRAMTVTDSILSAIMRVGIAIAASISLILAIIGIFSVLQRNGNHYISLLNYRRFPSSNQVQFDHIVSNATIRLLSSNDTTRLKPIPPRYSACELSWSGREKSDSETSSLSIIDLALLSEVAYMDDDSEMFVDTESVLNDLFPGLGMSVVSAPRLREEGLHDPCNCSCTKNCHWFWL